MAETGERKKAGRGAIAFVLLVACIDAIGFGIIIPVLPDLIQEVAGTSVSGAAVWGGYLSFSYAVMQFLFGPAVGNLSDRFGRKPVLLVSLFVLAVDFLIMALAQSLAMLFLGRLLGGIAAATHSTSQAFIADVSAKEDRARNFGLIGAAFGTGFILGPALGGMLGEWGPRAPFVAAGLLACANVAFGLVVLRESLPATRRRPFVLARANPVSSFARLGRLRGVGLMLGVYFIYEVAMIAYPATWAYFTAERFGWGPGMIGVSLAVFGISFAIMQGAVVRIAVRHWGEWRTIRRGLVANALVLTGLAFVTDPRAGLALAAVSASGAVVVPALQSLMSARVPADSQGELQGLVSSAKAVSLIVGPMGMAWIFFAFTRADAPVYLPGAAFLVALALVAVAALLLIPARRQGERLGDATSDVPREGQGPHDTTIGH